MIALMLLYLCTDANRTDCQVLPVERFTGPSAYEHCVDKLPAMTASLSAKNRQRHQFVCDLGDPGEQADQVKPTLIHQSFRM